MIADRAGAVAHSGIDQAKIVNEQGPADPDESGAEAEPIRRLAELSEKNRFDQGTSDVEKIMSKFERPSDHGDDVQNCARPENEDDEQSGDDIEPEKKLALDDHGVRVLNQNG